MSRLNKAQAVGLIYPDNILAFKLLKNSNMDAEVQSAVFGALQSRTDPAAEDMFLQTFICLTSFVKIEVEDAVPAKQMVIYILY